MLASAVHHATADRLRFMRATKIINNIIYNNIYNLCCGLDLIGSGMAV